MPLESWVVRRVCETPDLAAGDWTGEGEPGLARVWHGPPASDYIIIIIFA
jgi:hypothetical protein